MPNIIDILARALSLRQETALNSITPNRAGGIMYDTLLVLNQMQLEGCSLLISKVYASVSAMEADTTPTSDLTGRALKPGQLVVIVTSDSSSSDMGSEYRFNGPGSWTYVGKVGGLPLDTVPTQSSTKGITSGGVYTALAAMKAEGYKYMGLATPGSGGTAPGTPNQPVFYIAGPGSYPNFGSITVASGYLGFIKYSSGSWIVESVAVGKDYDEQISTLDGQISQLEAKTTFFDQNYGIFTIRGYRRLNDGTMEASGAFNTTELLRLNYILDKTDGIKIKSGKFRSPSSSAYSVAYFYDESGNFLSYYNGTTTFSSASPFPASAIPANAYYVSFNQYADNSAVFLKDWGYDALLSEVEDSSFAKYKEIFGFYETIFSEKGGYRNSSNVWTPTNYDCSTKLIDIDLIPGARTDGISFFGSWRSSSRPTALFYNASGTFLSYYNNTSTFSEITPFPASAIPVNAKYVVFNSYDGNGRFDDVTIKGYGYVSLYERVTRISDNLAGGLPGVNIIANDWISPNGSELTSKFNAAIPGFCTLCGCSAKCMSEINSEMTIEERVAVINHNFRDDVVNENWDGLTNARRINEAFTKPIFRFCDAKMRGGVRDFSLSTGLQADEPSAIVKDGKLYIYANLKRIYTEDGVNWSQAETVTLSGGPSYIMHINVNYIDGVYYLVGTDSNSGGRLYLFTSVDGINFAYNQVLFQEGQQIGEEQEKYWGNSYLMRDYGTGTWYLFVEYQPIGDNWIPWRIAVATSSNISNGFSFLANNPVLSFPGITAGNPDFAKGEDNRPIKHGGHFYMYYHSTNNSWATIRRAKSSDLLTWVDEGIIFDNRDQPTGGDLTSGNADHCIVEFKGRVYLFYSWDINDPNNLPYIKYTVDDRRFTEILSLRP